MIKTIDQLPEGVKIKVIKVSEIDAYFFEREEIEGREFISTKRKEYTSMSFRPLFKSKKLSGIPIIFYSETTYKIIKS